MSKHGLPTTNRAPSNNEMQLTVGAREARPEWGSPCGEPKLSPSERRQEAPPAADLGVLRTRVAGARGEIADVVREP
jgi:hypothetical protein